MNRYLLRAVAACVSRERFGDAHGLFVALGGGIVLLRAAAYTVLTLAQYPGYDASGFMAMTLSVMLTLWALTGTVSLVHASQRAAPAYFFLGTAASAGAVRRWRLLALFARPMSAVVLTYGILFLATAVAHGTVWTARTVLAPAPALLGVLLSLAGVRRETPWTQREVSVLEPLLLLSVAYLAGFGPDFVVEAGVVQPVVLGRPVGVEAAPAVVLLVLVPIAALAVQLAVVAGLAWLRPRLRGRFRRRRGIFAGRRAGLRSGMGTHPLRAHFSRRFGLGYWIGLALIVIVAASTEIPAVAVVMASAAFGACSWAVNASALTTKLRDSWRLRAPFSGLSRSLFVAGASIVAGHAAVAIAITVLLAST